MHYENSLTPDSSLFFKGKVPNWFSVALCERPFSRILTLASLLLFLPPGRHSTSFPYILYIYCFLSLFSFPVFHPSFSAFMPSTPSVSLSVSQACLSPPRSLSWTHVGLIELEDPALIKARVWLNASKPLRLQSRAGK